MQHYNIMNNTCKRRGISLIEVLIVLVLLLIGIFSIVRLFPGGFLVNIRSEEQTLGGQLAKQEMDRFANSVQNLMDGIVPVVPVPAPGAPGYAFQVDLNTPPDDLGFGQPNALGVDPYYYSDSNKIRRILGEQVRIPIASPTSAGRGSIYVLSSGPIYNVAWDGKNESVFVSGTPMSGSQSDSSASDPPDLFGPLQYAIDYDNHKLYFFPVNFDRQFQFSYGFFDANNQVQTVVDEVLNVPAFSLHWFDTVGNGGRPLVADSDFVARKFARIVPVGGVYPWSPTDPYQYDILSLNDGQFANVGVMVFNPLGHDYTENSPTGPRPLTARIDYDALDWHIIHEDRPMPGNSPFQVKTTLRRIMQSGENLNDQSTYIGIFRDPSILAANRADVLIYDLNSGNRVPFSEYKIDYKLGIVTFTDNFGALNASGNFRFFYKAHGDWALSIQKAASQYRRSGAPDVGYAQYFIPLNPGDPGTPTRMYFALIDAGKTVAIRQFWWVDQFGTSHPVTNDTFRINANRTNFEVLAIRPLTYLDLKEKFPQDLSDPSKPYAVRWDPVPAGQPAVGVQGVSFRSRVIWNDGGRVDTGVTGNTYSVRWRKIDLDTFMARDSNK
jgi:type II secretory pathway pseudopilin PulG